MEKIVFVVDDDDSVRQSLVRLLHSDGYAVKDFSSAEAFLNEPLPGIPACLVLDMKMPTSGGFDVIEALARKGTMLPVIFVTGYGTIPMTVRAMKAGAREFLTKPISGDELLLAVRDAIEDAKQNLQSRSELAELTLRYATLTPREREVLGLAIGGLLNKQIAMELDISEVTAKFHKHKVMEKMKTKSLADLVRVAERLHIVKVKSR